MAFLFARLLLNSKKSITFAPWTCAEGCLTSLAEGSRHIKKAFISALFWPFGMSQLSIDIQDLATIDVLRDIRLSLLCLFMVCLLRIYVCAHAYLNYCSTRVCFIFGVGFALSVLISKAMRQPQKVELANASFTLFLYASIIVKQQLNDKRRQPKIRWRVGMTIKFIYYEKKFYFNHHS